MGFDLTSTLILMGFMKLMIRSRIRLPVSFHSSTPCIIYTVFSPRISFGLLRPYSLFSTLRSIFWVDCRMAWSSHIFALSCCKGCRNSTFLMQTMVVRSNFDINWPCMWNYQWWRELHLGWVQVRGHICSFLKCSWNQFCIWRKMVLKFGIWRFGCFY